MPIVRLDPVGFHAGPPRPSFVALPGLNCNSYSYPPSLFKPLREGGMTVYLMEYGPHVNTIGDMATYIWTCLENMEATFPVVLLGLSMGGFVAQAMYRQKPSLVTGIIFLSTTSITAGDLYEPLLDPSTLIKNLKLWTMSSKQYRKKMIQDITDMHFDGQLPIPLDEYLHVMENSSISKEMYAKEWGAILAFAVSNVSPGIVRSIKPPVLLIYGSEDPVIPAESIRRLRNARSAASFTEVEIPGKGHGAMYEAPVIFTQAITKWAKDMSFI